MGGCAVCVFPPTSLNQTGGAAAPIYWLSRYARNPEANEVHYVTSQNRSSTTDQHQRDLRKSFAVFFFYDSELPFILRLTRVMSDHVLFHSTLYPKIPKRTYNIVYVCGSSYLLLFCFIFLLTNVPFSLNNVGINSQVELSECHTSPVSFFSLPNNRSLSPILLNEVALAQAFLFHNKQTN